MRRCRASTIFYQGVVIGACLYLTAVNHILAGNFSPDPLSILVEKYGVADDSRNDGILSRKPPEFFTKLQNEIDSLDSQERCQRYGWTYNISTTLPSPRIQQQSKRRIFYGALLAEEPWELLEIMAVETRDIFAGMVFVESNRTQSFAPRRYRRTTPHHQTTLQQMFGAPVLVLKYSNEDPSLRGLERENYQRGAIVQGWKALGMQPDDLGYIADTDETMTRDMLRAVQRCDNIPVANYSHHQCHPRKGARLYSLARIFEGTPDCITRQRSGHHPSLVMGACIEGIAHSDSPHPVAPRINLYTRRDGFGRDCGFGLVPSASKVPLWNPADFRMILCGDQPMARPPHDPTKEDDDINSNPDYSRFTGYHLHNFFADFNAIRHKYKTYGHSTDGTIPRKQQTSMLALGEIHADLGFLHSCVGNDESEDLSKYKPRVQGGFAAIPKYFVPLYFMDDDYRRRRQKITQEKILADDLLVAEHKQRQQGHQTSHVAPVKQKKLIIKMDLT